VLAIRPADGVVQRSLGPEPRNRLFACFLIGGTAEVPGRLQELIERGVCLALEADAESRQHGGVLVRQPLRDLDLGEGSLGPSQEALVLVHGSAAYIAVGRRAVASSDLTLMVDVDVVRL
jgi:hypothetical protein